MNNKLKYDEPGNPFSPHAKWYGIKRLARSPIDNWTTPRSKVFKKSGEREIKVREREREWKKSESIIKKRKSIWQSYRNP